MREQQSLWAKIPTWTKYKLVGLCCLLPMCAVALVIPKSSTLEADATLAQWAEAQPSVKLAWAKSYTREHTGVDDLGRTRELIDYLDSLTDDRALDHADLRVLADAGASLMRWSIAPG